MATGYSIRRGYNSCHSAEEVDAALNRVVSDICSTPERIAAEALLVEGREIPAEFVALYRQPWSDLTIQCVDDGDGLSVLQMATGGGVDRANKEAMRRAFCRLVMESMHAMGMEISVSVT